MLSVAMVEKHFDGSVKAHKLKKRLRTMCEAAFLMVDVNGIASCDPRPRPPLRSGAALRFASKIAVLLP